MLEAVNLAKAVWAFTLRHWATVTVGLLALAFRLELVSAHIDNHRLGDQLRAAAAQRDGYHQQLDTLAQVSATREEAAKAQALAAQSVARQFRADASKIMAIPRPPAGADLCQATQALIASSIAEEHQ